MIYLEMSRDEDHGGGTWGFANCVWAPTQKQNNANWIFWSKVSEVREGDLILHLRGKTPEAYFVGYSTASGNGFETTQRPPNPGEWNFAKAFYRADLTQFTPFHQPIKLTDLFASRDAELNAYFDWNKQRPDKTNIFFVRQSKRLQCLNGAYFSDIDDELLVALFGEPKEFIDSSAGSSIVSVETSTQISTVRSRLGQAKFSSLIRRLYGNHCCFPGCSVSDDRFLVGSHIARWSDNEKLRGHAGNGLCLCLIHDRAFEIGLYTLDESHNIFINPKHRTSSSEIVQGLLPQHGKAIREVDVKPLADALLEHWIRVDIDPSI
jgi:hypothetical protein